MPGLQPEQIFLAFDQPKTNLFWLVEPRIDIEGIESARHNPIARSINEHMFGEARQHLKLLPIKFLSYWLSLPQVHTYSIAEYWPSNWQSTMTQRAYEAQERLLVGNREDNVVHLNFRRSA